MIFGSIFGFIFFAFFFKWPGTTKNYADDTFGGNNISLVNKWGGSRREGIVKYSDTRANCCGYFHMRKS